MRMYRVHLIRKDELEMIDFQCSLSIRDILVFVTILLTFTIVLTTKWSEDPLLTDTNVPSEDCVSEKEMESVNNNATRIIRLTEVNHAIDIHAIGLQQITNAVSIHNKDWSYLNKFKVQLHGTKKPLMLKMETGSIMNEFVYVFVANVLGTEQVLLPTPRVVLGCDTSVTETFWNEVLRHDPWARANKWMWQKKKTSSNLLIGSLTPFAENIKDGWDVSDHCFKMEDPRAFAVVVMDYAVGYVDRPANCHLVDDEVYAVDNDSGYKSLWFNPEHADFQSNWLFEQTQENPAAVCAWIKRHSDFLHVTNRNMTLEIAHQYASQLFSQIDQECGERMDQSGKYEYRTDDYERTLAGIHTQLLEHLYATVKRYERLQHWIVNNC